MNRTLQPHERIIYSGQDDVKVIFDPKDTDLPIAVDDGINERAAWLTREEALGAAAAIFAQFGAVSPQTVINNTTPATVHAEHGDERESWNHVALQAAIDHGRVAEFRYAKGDGGIIETRRVEPEAITQSRRGALVTGWDPDRRDVRAFRLDRIQGYVSVA